ncbi:MAG: hypothetical protein FWD81_00575 [Methanomassiliicoccaceae archaeon]|nr:hypothetical protein [Methanomassiliicoccaceae archaeon]
MNADDTRERKIAWAMLILCPLSMMIVCAIVTMGYGRGLIYHPMGYLQVTCILWAVIMLVLPVLRLMRVIALPLWFVVLLYADMYMFVLSLCHGMYFETYLFGIWGWGDITHVISGLVVASIVFMALCLMEAHSPKHVTLGGRGGIAVLVFIIGCAFGAIWEMMEGFTDIISNFDYMSYGGVFTLYDLLADAIGALLMAVVAFVILTRHDARHVASKIRLGKRNIDVNGEQ